MVQPYGYIFLRTVLSINNYPILLTLRLFCTLGSTLGSMSSISPVHSCTYFPIQSLPSLENTTVISPNPTKKTSTRLVWKKNIFHNPAILKQFYSSYAVPYLHPESYPTHQIVGSYFSIVVFHPFMFKPYPTCSLPLWRVHEIKCTYLAPRIHGLFIT